MTKQKLSKQERFWLTMAFITSATVSCAGVYAIYNMGSYVIAYFSAIL